MQLNRIDKNNLEELVRLSYKDDFEGMEKFHVEPFDYETSVIKTLKMIAEVESEMPMKYFEVVYQGKQIGYVTLTRELLYSFCISKSYRDKRGVLRTWWEMVKKEMDEVFICILNRRNTRAVKFLKKMGMSEFDIGLDSTSITLTNV